MGILVRGDGGDDALVVVGGASEIAFAFAERGERQVQALGERGELGTGALAPWLMAVFGQQAAGVERQRRLERRGVTVIERGLCRLREEPGIDASPGVKHHQRIFQADERLTAVLPERLTDVVMFLWSWFSPASALRCGQRASMTWSRWRARDG